MSDRVRDKYRLDGHKLYWHLDRVLAWQRGERVAPLHIDVGLSKGCNIKCHYCFGLAQGNLYRKGRDIYFPRRPLLRYMREAGQAGVRSLAIIGEAEPLLNPHVYEAIVTGKRAGVDMGLGTNGVLYDTGPQGQEALEHLTFIRFNLSAASAQAYRRLHASKDFEVLMEKVRFCVAERRRRNLPVTIGFQMVLTPQDADQAVPLARLGRELGIDYLEIKHCGDTPDNTLGIYDKLDTYHRFTEILQEAEELSTDSYSVIVKWATINSQGKRDYDACLGGPLLIYSSGDGLLYPCGQFFSYREEEFRLGNLIEQGFLEIIESDHYWEVMERLRTQVNVHQECYTSCKTNAINRFLWHLQHPPQHVNFV